MTNIRHGGGVDRRRLMLSVGAAISCSAVGRPGFAQPEDDAADFQKEVLAILRSRFPGRVFEPGPTSIEILSPPHHLYLPNIYARTRGMAVEARKTVIAAWFEALDRLGPMDREAFWKDWARAAPLIRPRLLRESMPGVQRLARRAFVGDLVIVYVIDTPTSAIFINESRLSAWMIDQDHLHDRAIANLNAASDKMPIEAETFEGSTQEIVTISLDDSYDAARILLPSVRQSIHAVLGPIVLAVIPDRDVFIAWPKGFARRDKLDASVIEAAREAKHPLSSLVLCLADGGVRLAANADLDLKPIGAPYIAPETR